MSSRIFAVISHLIHVFQQITKYFSVYGARDDLQVADISILVPAHGKKFHTIHTSGLIGN